MKKEIKLKVIRANHKTTPHYIIYILRTRERYKGYILRERGREEEDCNHAVSVGKLHLYR